MVKPVNSTGVVQQSARSRPNTCCCTKRIQKIWNDKLATLQKMLDYSVTYFPRLLNYAMSMHDPHMMPTAEYEALELRANRGELTEEESKIYQPQRDLRIRREWERKQMTDPESDMAPSDPSNRERINKQWAYK